MTKANKARQLMAEGKPLKEIAAMLGVTMQYLYTLRYHDKKRGLKPVPKKSKATKKRKPAKKLTPMKPEDPQPNAIIYLPQPEPKLSFMQRLRVLFTGVV